MLGQGTWHMGERRCKRAEEIAALRLGLDLGMTLIDTAQLYRGADHVIKEAIAGRRDECFIVDKVLPMHATRLGTIESCESSLRRLGTDRIDLLLLHWRGQVPLEQTVAGFEELIDAGKLRYWGVSNFDTDDLMELESLGVLHEVVTDQVLYNLEHRGIEYDLLPFCRAHGISIMAYAPLGEGALLCEPRLCHVAARTCATPAQVALAWVMRHPDVIAIPKAGKPEHVRENRGALDIQLSARDLVELDTVFQPPACKVPLDVI